MEFTVLFLPAALLIIPMGLWSIAVDRRLIRLAKARYPDALDAVRGRPRRWHDGSDELEMTAWWVRPRLLAQLTPRAAADPELAAALDRSERVNRLNRRVGAAAGLLTVALLVAARLLLG